MTSAKEDVRPRDTQSDRERTRDPPARARPIYNIVTHVVRTHGILHAAAAAAAADDDNGDDDTRDTCSNRGRDGGGRDDGGRV